MAQTNYYKAAVFLSALPDEQCVEILRSFDEEDVEKICRELMSLSEVNDETRKNIVQEFRESLSGSAPTLKAGADYVQGILARVYGVRRSEAILNHMKEQSESKVDLDELVGEIGAASVVEELKTEHPRVITTIVSSISYQKASSIMMAFPDDIQLEVFRSMATTKPMPADLTNKIKQGFIQKLMSKKTNSPGFEKEGIRGSAEILSLLPTEKTKKIIESIKAQDEGLAFSIESAIFSFDDLVKMEDRDIQKIIAKVNQNELKLALRLCSNDAKEKIFKNMSERAAGMLKDDLQVMAPQKKEVVVEAQQKVIEVIRKMDEAGEVKIPRPQPTGGGAVKQEESALV